MFLAAIDSGDIPIAEKCLDKLQSKFPNSSRALRLSGIFYELQGISTMLIHMFLYCAFVYVINFFIFLHRKI